MPMYAYLSVGEDGENGGSGELHIGDVVMCLD